MCKMYVINGCVSVGGCSCVVRLLFPEENLSAFNGERPAIELVRGAGRF